MRARSSRSGAARPRLGSALRARLWAALTLPSQIYGLPTVMIFKNGEMLEGSKREGAITKDKLMAHLATFRIERPAPPAEVA